jgi:hypothetical protein
VTAQRCCFVCRSSELTCLLDIGRQPISNRFLRSPTEGEERFPIALQQCAACGLVQIEEPVPALALIPPFDWITYNEPEGHLDELVGILVGLPGVGPGAVAGGVSFKDDSTLARLERRGLQSWRLDLRDDLGVSDAGSGHGVETIQDRLTPRAAERIVRRRGAADVLLVRHILEHATLPLDFIEALKILTKPAGYIVVEVPDCSRAMDGCDYTTIWEEHTLYYTADTFRHGLSVAALDIVRMEDYEYPFENSLVAIAQSNGTGSVASLPAAAVERERQRGLTFGRSYPGYRERVRRFLGEYRRSRGPIALFGAGHLACMFVNLFEVGEWLEFVIDDNPHKLGLYMPGSKLPIVTSAELLTNEIALCLLSLNPIGQQKVIEKNGAFVARGGTFASIFPASANAIAC